MSSTEQRDAVVPTFPPGKLRLSILCHRCGYNLKGSDPAGACPECGMAVWPSLRPFVDPSDERLVLLKRPGRLGVCLVAVSAGMLLSAVALWWPYAAALWRQIKSPGSSLIPEFSIWHYVIVGVLALVSVGATLGLQHPTGAAAPTEYRQGLVRARAGLAAWLLLHAVLLWYDRTARAPVREWYDLVQVDAVRSLVRVGLDGAALTMVLGFRPVVKFLSRRSVPHRLGGASRQGFLAVFMALLAVFCGDLIRLMTWALDAAGLAGLVVDNAALIGTMLVLVGSAMMTLALLNLAIDSSRLARNLARCMFRLEEVIG